MAVHHGPIEERINWLLDLAHRHTAEFRSPDACLAREHYQARHPTAIVVLKCMDGRIDVPVVTQTPPGIIQPFRNLGGMFDLGWPYLGEVLANHIHRQIAAGKRVLLLITYHFSRGSEKRGCAGFGYNTQAAIDFTGRIKEQAERIFGASHATVYPIICGLETDEDALLIHGRDGRVLDLSRIDSGAAGHLRSRVEELFPDMNGQMQKDLTRLLQGNLNWMAKVRQRGRTLEIEHREWMICLGRGFDFLHTPNLALIIGPYSPDLADPIRKAAGIIENNMKAGRIPDDGFLLFASVPYEDIGPDQARAELKSRFLADFASQVIRTHHPHLAERMHRLTAVLSWRSRALSLLPEA
ncbi:carboxysome shell carbonic anhydrase [Geothermobacter ehrlichii]|uniref:Carboxysome shell carbonic anhydrase n=1 Tax=Geothermobacter ehrlichii TaxID=213224 RepID=A0A5D3WLA0_9BACT|nr:carboxysome shell carbonic anhydrase domain-containg protein [Geothermobacter ehrlichii]TYO98904.1 carboxysome shell carbonic anhydrase [Geothermobacter ehrlichii]